MPAWRRPGLRRALVRAAAPDEGEPTSESAAAFDELQARLRAAQATVARIFARHCPEAAAGDGPVPPV